MKLTLAIPTYWCRESTEAWREGDLVFDHPTPLDQSGTLLSCLESLENLSDSTFDVVIVVVVTAPGLEAAAVERVSELTAGTNAGRRARLLTPRSLRALGRGSGNALADPVSLSLNGYAQVRNGCLLAAACLDSDAVILIDDDELIDQRDFLVRIREGLTKNTWEGSPAVLAGYYRTPAGGYLLNRATPPWGEAWPKFAAMDEAFRKFIGMPPRYKLSPFAFGGNMAIPRGIFEVLPFDPALPRGEDIDYLITARMFGYPTLLDNELHVTHIAPPEGHPEWRQFRQDAVRFVYEREKLRISAGGGEERLTPVHAAELDPYPGIFLRGDLDERIERTATALAEHAAAVGDETGARKAEGTIELCRATALDSRHRFAAYFELRKQWCDIMEYMGTHDCRDIFE